MATRIVDHDEHSVDIATRRKPKLSGTNDGLATSQLTVPHIVVPVVVIPVSVDNSALGCVNPGVTVAVCVRGEDDGLIVFKICANEAPVDVTY